MRSLTSGTQVCEIGKPQTALRLSGVIEIQPLRGCLINQSFVLIGCFRRTNHIVRVIGCIKKEWESLLGSHFYVIFFEELFLVESSLVPKSVVVVISAYGFGKGVGKGLCGEVDVEIKHSVGTADAHRTNEFTRPRSVFSMM